MEKQQIFLSHDKLKGALLHIIHKNHPKHIFVVGGRAIQEMNLKEHFSDMGILTTFFSGYEPNPSYESAVRGSHLFREKECDFLIAAGGGSAIDVAKCIKMFYGMDPKRDYLSQAPVGNRIPLLAVPTTAGTGSEATQFAVIYRENEKQSISHEMLLPQYVILCPELLASLPVYQRKATMLDAYCHAVESFWSLRSTKTSKEYSRLALKQFHSSWSAYMENLSEGNEGMLLAANTAGKAINLAQTTAAHAMSYKLTSLYHIAHGHAAAICLAAVWEFLLEKSSDCEIYSAIKGVLDELAIAQGCRSAAGSLEQYKRLLGEIGLPEIRMEHEEEINVLIKSVNPLRLKNFPVQIETEDFRKLYRKILKEG